MSSPDVTEVTVFRDLRRCGLIASYQRTGGTCCCCLHVTALLQHWNWFVRNIWRSLAVLKRRCRLFSISRNQWWLIGCWNVYDKKIIPFVLRTERRSGRRSTDVFIVSAFKKKYDFAVTYSRWHWFSLLIACGSTSVYDMIYLLTAVGEPPGGSSSVHIYTQTIHRTTQNKHYIEQHKNLGRVRAVPHLYGCYPGICLTTEEKTRKNLSQGSLRDT
jgi:hypothetical protein